MGPVVHIGMMEDSEVEESRPRGSLEFTESSTLDTIIPLASDLDIEDILSGSVERLDEGSDSPLAAIPQRQALFFGKCPHTLRRLCLLLIHRSQMKQSMSMLFYRHHILMKDP